jgi:chemotaxis protein methyltransferase CheR
MTQQFDLSEMEFGLLRDFIHEKFGVYFKDQKRSFMRMKLSPRVITHGFGSFNEYIQFVKYGFGNKREHSKMMSLLTNTETYFFRETPQLDVFYDVLLPELRERKLARNEKTIRVLSAGCSTGEEVYTLAMLTFETGKFFWEWDVQIMGMDINERALETAKSGIYYDRSFRMTDAKYMQRFFSPNTGNYKAKDNIKRMTSFISGNITDTAAWNTMRDIDVIFCRNVLIYFSDEKLKIAVENFYKALRKGGFLLLGHSETLTGIFDKFEPQRFPKTIIYKKKE